MGRTAKEGELERLTLLKTKIFLGQFMNKNLTIHLPEDKQELRNLKKKLTICRGELRDGSTLYLGELNKLIGYIVDDFKKLQEKAETLTEEAIEKVLKAENAVAVNLYVSEEEIQTLYKYRELLEAKKPKSGTDNVSKMICRINTALKDTYDKMTWAQIPENLSGRVTAAQRGILAEVRSRLEKLPTNYLDYSDGRADDVPRTISLIDKLLNGEPLIRPQLKRFTSEAQERALKLRERDWDVPLPAADAADAAEEQKAGPARTIIIKPPPSRPRRLAEDNVQTHEILAAGALCLLSFTVFNRIYRCWAKPAREL